MEQSIDDYWNTDADGSLSDTCISAARLNRGTSAGNRLTKKRFTPLTENSGPEQYSSMSAGSKREVKETWKEEKPRLDVVRDGKGIHCVSDDDEEFRITKNARRNQEMRND